MRQPISDSPPTLTTNQSRGHFGTTTNRIIHKLPAYGKELVARQQFNNPPFLVVICVGQDSWSDAKEWQQRTDICPLVLTPDQQPHDLQWPVAECRCLIEWSFGPGESLIIELVRCLLAAGAESVTVRPLFEDVKLSYCFYDTKRPIGQRWTPVRQMIKIYHQPRKEVRHVA
jgi:hypothetical protein